MHSSKACTEQWHWNRMLVECPRVKAFVENIFYEEAPFVDKMLDDIIKAEMKEMEKKARGKTIKGSRINALDL